MNQALEKEKLFQIPVNNWGFPHFLRTGPLQENDNWRNINGHLGTRLYWMLESLEFKLDFTIGEINYHREHKLQIPLKPVQRCCKSPLVYNSSVIGQDGYSTLCRYSFSPTMRLERGFEHVNNIQYAKQIPIFATRFSYEERDAYDAYMITTHLIDVKKHIVNKKRVKFDGSYFDLYLVSDITELEGYIMNADLKLLYFSLNT